jgi:hypothetical protein
MFEVTEWRYQDDVWLTDPPTGLFERHYWSTTTEGRGLGTRRQKPSWCRTSGEGAASRGDGVRGVAALFYSLIESAKFAGVEPRAYPREATLRAVRNPGTVALARDFKSSESWGKPVLDRLGTKTREWPRTY